MLYNTMTDEDTFLRDLAGDMKECIADIRDLVRPYGAEHAAAVAFKKAEQRLDELASEVLRLVERLDAAAAVPLCSRSAEMPVR